MKKYRESKLDNYYVWFNSGQELAKLGKYPEAMTNFKKALEIQPHSCQAWIALGHVLTHLDCYEEALKSFEQALKNYSYDEASCYQMEGVA